jgi:enoyl-[acyl-carrier protein] reductase I
MTPTGIMSGKRGLIMGVANDHSLAWGIARNLAAHGAEIAFTYQSEALEKRVRPLAGSLGFDFLIPCDAGREDGISQAFCTLKNRWDTIDFVVHAIAYSDKEELKGKYVDTTRKNFLNSLDISCFSFTQTCKEAADLMTNGGSLVTLTYHGAQRVMPHYNVMGVAKAALEASVRYLAVDLGGKNIRVNAISAGPAKTLASSAIGDFRYILQWCNYNSPLKRNTTLDDVGGASVYFLSDLSSGVTGEVHHVDSGYHVVGMKAVDAPDIATV